MAGRHCRGVPSGDRVDDADLPGGRRQADRLAVALYAVLVDRSEVDRRHVLRALQAPGTRGPRTAVRDHMASALRLCEAEIGRFPSYRAYEAWRLEQPSPSDWPSGSSVARAFSSWSAMLDALAVAPAARPQTVKMMAIGGAFTREELLEPIRRCGRELGKSPLTFVDYRRWAQATRHDDGHERVPLNITPFMREFGSFSSAVTDAGLEPFLKSKAAANRSWYSRGEIAAALRGASQDLGERAPTTTQYMRWRRALLEEARSRGSKLALPSDISIYAHFPTWADALHASGLVADDEVDLVRRRAQGEATSPQRVAKSLLEFQAAEWYGETRSDYMRWRAEQPRIFGRLDAPDNWGLVRRYGKWPSLMKLVQVALDGDDPHSELERLLAARLDERA
jgi:hypothetical protein